MVDILDYQPAMARVARSRAQVVSSFFEIPRLTSKTFFLHNVKTLSSWTSHQRTPSSDSEGPVPLYQERIVTFRGLGTEPAQKGLGSKATKAKPDLLSTVPLPRVEPRQPRTSQIQPITNPKLELENSPTLTPRLSVFWTQEVAFQKRPPSVTSLSSVETLTPATMLSSSVSKLRNLRANRRPALASGDIIGSPWPDPQTPFTSTPYIRPLEHKLRARNELPEPPPPLNPLTLDDLSELSERDVTSEGDWETVEDALSDQTQIADEDWTTDPDLMLWQDYTARTEQINAEQEIPNEEEVPSQEDKLQLEIACRHEFIATAAGRDRRTTPDWRAYIKSYSRGNFNLSKPPRPPRMSRELEYLPSVFPRAEAQRVSTYNSLGLSWNPSTTKRMEKLLISIWLEFGMTGVAISFFDTEYEHVQVEHGYDMKSIPREKSIAAHALLSADVLVVEDTQKDWRFRGNPLVSSGLDIRFYAGAPILAPDGQPIGILSIISETCQAPFTPFDRQKLANFASAIMAYLIKHSTPSEQSALSAEGSQAINGSSPGSLQPGTVGSGSHELDQGPSPSHNSMLKTPSTGLQKSDYLTDSPASFSTYTEQESSPVSGFVHGNLGSREQFGTYSNNLTTGLGFLNLEQLKETPPKPFHPMSLNLHHEQSTSTLVDSQTGSPRVSTSSLSLKHPRGRHTPLSETTNDCRLLGDGDNDAPGNGSPVMKLARQKISRAVTSPTPLSPHVPKPKATPPTPAASYTGRNISQQESREIARAQAAKICRKVAQRCGFDLVYAAELNPSLDAVNEDRVYVPGAPPGRLLAAYGMSGPVKTDPEVDMTTLRSRGVYHWHTSPVPGANSTPYEFGCIVATPSQGTVGDPWSSGIFIGAFKKPQQDGAVRATDEELRVLQKAGNSVKNLLWADSGSPLMPLPLRTLTGKSVSPASPLSPSSPLSTRQVPLRPLPPLPLLASFPSPLRSSTRPEAVHEGPRIGHRRSSHRPTNFYSEDSFSRN